MQRILMSILLAGSAASDMAGSGSFAVRPRWPLQELLAPG